MNPARWFTRKVGGEYELGKTLGKGHFSKVKLGVHVRTRKQVAIKVMGVSPVAVWSPPRMQAFPRRPTVLFSGLALRGGEDCIHGGGGLPVAGVDPPG